MNEILRGACPGFADPAVVSTSPTARSASTSPAPTTLLLICSSCPRCRLTGRLYGRARRITLPSMEGLQRRLAVARGDEPADLVVRGGKDPSVLTREWARADSAY